MSIMLANYIDIHHTQMEDFADRHQLFCFMFCLFASGICLVAAVFLVACLGAIPIHLISNLMS